MKTIGTIFSIICLLVAAGLAIAVVVEHQARCKLDQENGALRQQLSQLAQLTAEDHRLSDLVAQAAAPQAPLHDQTKTPAATDGRLQELVRLRSEVEALRQQSKEIEVLRADTRQVRAAQGTGRYPQHAGNTAGGNPSMTASGSQLEILSADYGTVHTNMDVAEELREKIRGDGLKAVASNNLKGDPEFGQVKHLTVVYRFGGVTRTNEFRENDLVILPRE
jgi:hypothetical protein